MSNILITGAANGLGRAFLQHYSRGANSSSSNNSNNKENRIFAIDISWPEDIANTVVSDTTTTSTTTGSSTIISYHKTDITSESDLANLVQSIRQTEEEPKLDLVIHAAGVRGLVTSASSSSSSSSGATSAPVMIKESSDVAKAETLEVMTTAVLMRTFQVNAVGTFELIRHLLPFLRRRRQRQGQPRYQEQEQDREKDLKKEKEKEKESTAKVIIMGSRMGSISSNASAGGGYAYRASKAALNAIIKSLAIDVPEVCFIVTHPGRVATALCDGVREDGAMDPEQVLPGLIALIEDKWTLADSGRFFDRFGKEIGW